MLTTRYLPILFFVLLFGLVGNGLSTGSPGGTPSPSPPASHQGQTSTHDTIDSESGKTKYKFKYTGNATKPTVTGVKNPAGTPLKEVSVPDEEDEYRVDVDPITGEVTITFGTTMVNGDSYEIETTRQGGSTPTIGGEGWS